MESTPKSLRLQIGIFGRTNVGKSSFLNMIAGQDVAVTSPLPGTTTDVVEKVMELLPIGPVVFLDTAGFDDVTELSDKRLAKTIKILDRADIAILIVEPNIWTDFENEIIEKLNEKNINFFVVVNKIDETQPTDSFLSMLGNKVSQYVLCSSTNKSQRENYINQIKSRILNIIPDDYNLQVPLLSDIIKKDDVIVLIVPIDSQAPKGRLILPQVQSIRDILDNNAVSVVVQDTEYSTALKKLKEKPALVVCDSQVVHKMVAETPQDVKCTTFSILFSRYKGDLNEEVRGAAIIKKLKPGDKILIAEACTHHPLEDDIGRIKIPRWLRNYIGGDVVIDYSTGRDFPDNLNDYRVIIHCGSCMLTRREKLMRIRNAIASNVPITNYGITISMVQGVLERVLSPFEDALRIYKEELNS
ncbi:MAG: [FeFe] hydrogenase H-cluster maturation GTPase HydF [Candidatus Kapabacteria bacterium]|nr:[FeFe] hydrogenase H-cluster maturation GTPase HydF [Candidatus Kapabacteria bacterium]